MRVSRPLLIALVGVVLVAGAFLAIRGGGDAPASPPATAGTPVDAPADARASAVGSPTGERAAAAEASGAARRPQSPGAPRARGVPLKVERALADDRVAMIFLHQPGAADDSATLAAVRQLDAARRQSDWLRERSVVFTDPITSAADYLGLTQTLGVTRAPAVLLLQPGGQARLLEGYTDARSLRQHLADALR